MPNSATMRALWARRNSPGAKQTRSEGRGKREQGRVNLLFPSIFSLFPGVIMPRIEQSVVIAAPIAHVYRVARDVEAFPHFMEDLQSLTVKERDPDGLRTITEWVGLIREFKM